MPGGHGDEGMGDLVGYFDGASWGRLDALTISVDLRQHAAALGIQVRLRRTCGGSSNEEVHLQQKKSYSIKPMTITGIAASILFGLAGASFTPAPAEAVVYCQYINYPPSCVARAGVVLRPRPVARAAVRAGTASPSNLNGGVNRVGVRR